LRFFDVTTLFTATPISDDPMSSTPPSKISHVIRVYSPLHASRTTTRFYTVFIQENQLSEMSLTSSAPSENGDDQGALNLVDLVNIDPNGDLVLVCGSQKSTGNCNQSTRGGESHGFSDEGFLDEPLDDEDDSDKEILDALVAVLNRLGSDDSDEETLIGSDTDDSGHASDDETDGQVAFRVCSRTMGRASAVFTAMLFGGWVESKPAKGQWIVYLPEDAPSSMQHILSFSHGIFSETYPTGKELLGITVLADKYDMDHLLKPCLWHWRSTALEGIAFRLVGGPELPERLKDPVCLALAWKMGHAAWLRHVASAIVQKSWVHAEDEGEKRRSGRELVFPNFGRLTKISPVPVPEEALGKMDGIRFVT
jgi:hypothetical protein